MRFPPTFIDEIKTRLPVSDVVRRRVKLTKSGREWKGLSPFNSEKTPSFFVNDQKMAWFDFSSGRNGNIFDFVMATEGLPFPEAVERLASEAGLALPVLTRENEAQEKRRAGLHEVLEAAAQFFERQLQSRAGAKARAYLEGRGLSRETQVRFRLGYAPPERYTLRDELAAKNASVETMIEAGLLIHGDEIKVPYDRFRDRVMFPIADRSGRMIAFGGRALDKEAQAKYLNSPETPLFHKSAVLYNHHNARKAAHQTGTVIAVEGYVDTIAMVTAGFEHTVATLGTALTAEHCDLLWRMAEEPILCFDGDKAGRKAAHRTIDMALPLVKPGRSLRFALLPDGQDPDDLARSGGAAALAEVLDRAQPLVDMIWAREVEANPLTTPERRAAFERRLSDIAQTIGDPILRRHYEADFKNCLAALFAREPVRREGAPGARRPWVGRNTAGRGAWMPERRQSLLAAPPAVSASMARSSLFRDKSAGLSTREAVILLLLINHPALLADHAEEIATLELASKDAVSLRETLLTLLSQPDAGPASVRAHIRSAGLAATLARIESMPAVESHWYLQPDAAIGDAETVLKQALILHRKTRALHKELNLAEVALATDDSAANLARMRDIQEQISALVGTEAAVEGFGTMSGRPGKSL